MATVQYIKKHKTQGFTNDIKLWNNMNIFNFNFCERYIKKYIGLYKGYLGSLNLGLYYVRCTWSFIYSEVIIKWFWISKTCRSWGVDIT